MQNKYRKKPVFIRSAEFRNYLNRLKMRKEKEWKNKK